MRVERLGEKHEECAREFLRQSPVINVFLLSFLHIESLRMSHWYGVFSDQTLLGLTMILPGQLMVPWCPDEQAAALLGKTLHGKYPACLTVGPRNAVDMICEHWGPVAGFKHTFDQHLYAVTTIPSATDTAQLNKAQFSDLAELTRNSAQMQLEDLGANPLLTDEETFRAKVAQRALSGKTWVLKQGEEIVFQINVGTESEWGAQVGGTYVPLKWRGKGYAKTGMRAIVRQLLHTVPVVTLHVRENNGAAIACYKNAGFQPNSPYRLNTPY
jgi:RimJ/RimL family protein N-acetyltransferase